MNQDAQLPSTIVECTRQQQQQIEQPPDQPQHPYKHQGAYAIHRPGTQQLTEPQPSLPRYDCSTRPIPEDVRKSYVRQKLPVRKQSLAANYARVQPSGGLRPQDPRLSYMPNRSADPPSSFPPPSQPHHSSNQTFKPPVRTSSIVNLASLAPTNPLASRLLRAHGNERIEEKKEEEEEEDEEDFNFNSRPPSSIICTRPIVSIEATSPITSTIESDSAPQTPIDQLTDTEENVPTRVPLIDTRRPSELDSVDTATTASTRMDHADDANNWVLSPVSPNPSDHESTAKPSVQGEPAPTVDDRPRESCDTDFSELASPISPTDQTKQASRQSIFLRMQQKREEQRKSIYAYRYSRAGTPQPHASMIYPAILSVVARELYRRLPTASLVKDNIEHHNVFRGRDAVERLLSILRTHDRNLAVLVGRALDGQNFFHEVNYEHRLRDSVDELYQFRESIEAPMGLSAGERSAIGSKRPDNEVNDLDVPTGVFTVLTDCYSPTCTRERTCYSINCPRKAAKVWETISQIASKAHTSIYKSLKRSHSQETLQGEEIRNLWIHSVPKELVEATQAEERKRQECIYELIYTELDFVRDLQYVHNFWVKPLITQDIIPDERREHFVQEVFWNVADIEKVNSQMARVLSERQKNHYWIESIGDIMLEYACEFDPFVAYGAHQIIGKFYFELEKKRNPRFAAFVEETERKPESRRLELNGYLTKPTTRLGRYNLLLREILKRTPEDNPDRKLIPQIMELITEFLVQVNTEAGNSENSFNLQQIENRLSFKTSDEFVDLKLREPGRQLIMKGRMKRKGNTSSDASDLQLFLFDHYLVFAKIKYHNHLEYYKVYRKPIPLELLTVSLPKDNSNNRAKRASSILPYSRSATLVSSNTSIQPKSSTSETILASKSGNFTITFYHHGRRGMPPLTLYTAGDSSRKAWSENIKRQQSILGEKRCIFSMKPLVSKEFTTNNKINSSSVLHENEGPRVVIGADQGVYITDTTKVTADEDIDAEPVQSTARILHVEKVSQISLVDQSQLLVLSDKTLWAFPYDMMVSGELQLKSVRPISQHAAFFYVGECMGKTLVCVVKTSALTPTTIRVLEPVAAEEDKKSRRAFIKRLVRSGTENLKPYKDLYLPSEASAINLLRTKMCVSCPQEIGVIDMKTFEVQALLDPDDEELSFVFNRQDIRPVSIYRIQFAEYLVCYNEFAFCVDQRGRFKRSSCRIDWESTPDSFALCYPYILAFEPEFIEIRNILTGTLDQRIRGTNIRCTNTGASGKDRIHVAMNDVENDGYQVLYQLDLMKQHVDFLPQLPVLNGNTAW